MKKLNFAALSLAVFLYSGSAFAQHAHGGGAGTGAGAAGSGMGNSMGNSMGHSSMGSANSSSPHGAPNTTGSSQKPTVNDILTKNPAIGDKITALTGATSAADACAGFKNLGQCVAAAHVAKNLDGGNFYCLRQAMTGTAAPGGTTCSTTGSMSLGKAIQTLYPQTNASTESKKGQSQANQDMKSSGVKS
jgi:hypothetical protein